MEPDDSRSEGLGRAIRVIRNAQDMPRKVLAKQADLSYSYLAEIESGAKTPSTKVLGQIAEALGVAIHELMEAADRWEHSPPPHSFEELRDATRITASLDRGRSRSGPRGGAPGTRLGRASARREQLLGMRMGRSVSDERVSVEAAGPEEPHSLEQDAAELMAILEGLGPEDRERLLDLARRLADPE